MARRTARVLVRRLAMDVLGYNVIIFSICSFEKLR